MRAWFFLCILLVKVKKHDCNRIKQALSLETLHMISYSLYLNTFDNDL